MPVTHASPAASVHAQVGRCLFIAENALAVIVIHFLRYLPRPFPAAPVSASAAAAAAAAAATDPFASNHLLEEAAASLDLYNLEPPSEKDTAKLGSTADLAYFMSRLQVGEAGERGRLEGGGSCWKRQRGVRLMRGEGSKKGAAKGFDSGAISDGTCDIM